jgi:protein-S-isoprenylcysteine O-methyltransferase Ste14
MFFVRNALLQKRLGVPVRGRNREANLGILFIVFFIVLSFVLASAGPTFGTVTSIPEAGAAAVALILIIASVLIGTAAQFGLGDSWRVGIRKEQRTGLVEGGIFGVSRNPFFLSYLIMFAAYTILLRSLVLLFLSPIGFVLVHSMVISEERHLESLHGDAYRRYKDKVPRYLLFW